MSQTFENNEKHGHKKIKICVSGAAETSHCGIDSLSIAKDLGRQIAQNGAVLLVGATSGFPLWSAMGAKEVGGIVIGFSPAASEKEHIEVYKLPVDYMDIIIYTGFGYTGRDLLMVRSADAVMFGCGRIGTIHEFTIAFEESKPIGIVEGPWDTDTQLKDIFAKSNRKNDKIVSDLDLEILVKNIIKQIKAEKIDKDM